MIMEFGSVRYQFGILQPNQIPNFYRTEKGLCGRGSVRTHIPNLEVKSSWWHLSIEMPHYELLKRHLMWPQPLIPAPSLPGKNETCRSSTNVLADNVSCEITR